MIDFPLLEWDEEEERWDAAHQLFTGIVQGDEERLEHDHGSVVRQAYDLV